MKPRRVVITGLGALTPIGNTLTAYWEGLLSGKSGAGPITYFDPSLFKTQFACELKNFNPLDHFDRKESRKYDRFAQYALVSVAEAIEDAKLPLETIDKDRVGVIWGAGIGGLETFQNEVLNFAKGNENPRFNPFFYS
jgi:3-oxoacyl-[acyl-carrier-protein] synthase II